MVYGFVMLKSAVLKIIYDMLNLIGPLCIGALTAYVVSLAYPDESEQVSISGKFRHSEELHWWSGWRGGVFPRLPALGPQFEFHRGHYVNLVFSPYLTAVGFPWNKSMEFSPTSNTETSFLVFSPSGSPQV